MDQDLTKVQEPMEGIDVNRSGSNEAIGLQRGTSEDTEEKGVKR